MFFRFCYNRRKGTVPSAGADNKVSNLMNGDWSLVDLLIIVPINLPVWWAFIRDTQTCDRLANTTGIIHFHPVGFLFGEKVISAGTTPAQAQGSPSWYFERELGTMEAFLAARKKQE